MDLTPLDIRKKRSDFSRVLRGYDPGEVDAFLEMVAERVEEVVRENRSLQERLQALTDQVQGQEGREKAVQEALVAAQQLRDQIRAQARREAELLRREAEGEAEQAVSAGEQAVEEIRSSLRDLERRRRQFLERHRRFLERELDHLEAEEARTPKEVPSLQVDLGRLRSRVRGDEDEQAAEEASDPEVEEALGPGAGEESGRPDELEDRGA